MNIDRSAFLAIAAALSATACAPNTPAEGDEVVEADLAASASSCTPADLRGPRAGATFQGWSAPSPIDEGWADEVPLTRYYEQLFGRYQATQASASYREVTFTAVVRTFAATGRSAYELRAVDRSGILHRWVYWLSYASDRERIALTVADPAWVDPYGSSHPERCTHDGACPRAGAAPFFGGSFDPKYVGPANMTLLPDRTVRLRGGPVFVAATCEAPPAPIPRLETCSGGWAVGPTADPEVVTIRRPDGTTARYRRE